MKQHIQRIVQSLINMFKPTDLIIAELRDRADTQRTLKYKQIENKINNIIIDNLELQIRFKKSLIKLYEATHNSTRLK